ncbi:cysteine protease RD19A-like [Chenopodium quinoa]|uniref:Cysteine protease n=1 Tax=Chenopodium quinoa TaxID=63459 RepID=A0A803LPB1_CHEQI|nr:cysteine protease RD19A-like [Chenopodium quinoa]
MAHIFSLLTFSLLILTTAVSGYIPGAGEFSDDSLIRQVVDEDANSLDLSQSHHHFSLFKKRFGKSYATQEEHDYRFEIFKANLRQAKVNQALDPSAVHGVTRFSDLSESEFRSQFLGVKNGLKYPSHANKAPILPTDDLPLDFDWRKLGAVTPPKDQGGCGSCWSFSTTGAMEGAHFIATGKLESLSEQQLLDCDRECDPEGEPDDCDLGCQGGLMNNAFEYLLKAGGLMREEDYPYTARNGRCKFDKSKIAAKVANFSVVPVDEGQIAANLVKNGPLAVGINARYMSSYRGGVSCPLTCSADLEHGVLLVGFGSSGYSDMRKEEKPYWIIKNSWGEYWGENGYYRLCRGYDLCGVNTLVSTVAAAPATSQ